LYRPRAARFLPAVWAHRWAQPERFSLGLFRKWKENARRRSDGKATLSVFVHTRAVQGRLMTGLGRFTIAGMLAYGYRECRVAPPRAEPSLWNSLIQMEMISPCAN
jgi:hypothetical protein